ncbi:hypothetical protein K435DRAFT_796810 [Dendrothele bispora CBS 962.96]|uniref:Secreted protein n=1 Tax=Dendrothele bispora (strain CBS 962.96) TaxID=1314807 RepID=A0A4S8M5Q2_DENBC|nr:hypothetical protein K435DRAFT_796810 [Dendrothele bispora CBS 962.96]
MAKHATSTPRQKIRGIIWFFFFGQAQGQLVIECCCQAVLPSGNDTTTATKKSTYNSVRVYTRNNGNDNDNASTFFPEFKSNYKHCATFAGCCNSTTCSDRKWSLLPLEEEPATGLQAHINAVQLSTREYENLEF